MTRETAKIKVELLDNYLSHTCQDYGERDHEAMMMAIKALEQKPQIRPKGHWKKGASWSEGCGMGENYGYYYECSNCGETVQDGYLECSYSYCPYCGSDNREVEE